MRQLFTIVSAGRGPRAKEVAQEAGGKNILSFKTSSKENQEELILIQAANQDLDAIASSLSKEFPELRLTFLPQGIVSLGPPHSEVENDVTDITSLGPLEIYIAGLQSIGSWRGFMGFSVAAGIVVWVGLYTNTLYLLIAAMLIAPFAGPAMTLALGTARGDRILIRRSLLRYVSSLSVAMGTAALLSLAFKQKVATSLMIDISMVSAVATLLPLTAGAAGALVLCKSQRDSLVTAAGPGMLVAASLAPPAGVIGMAATFGQWGMVKTSAFLLLLQLVGINLAGSIVFGVFGIKPNVVRYERGERRIRSLSFSTSVLILGGLLLWQFSTTPILQRSSQSRVIRGEVKSAIEVSGLAKPVELRVRFTRDDLSQHTLLLDLYVQRPPDSEFSAQEIRSKLTQKLRREIAVKHPSVAPLMNVIVLE